MAHSIFFHHGYAIHGTIFPSWTSASHGRVRLLPENAAVLCSLVEQEGIDHARSWSSIRKRSSPHLWIAVKAVQPTAAREECLLSVRCQALAAVNVIAFPFIQ